MKSIKMLIEAQKTRSADIKQTDHINNKKIEQRLNETG